MLALTGENDDHGRVSLPEDDFAERSRSIFERLRAAQEPASNEENAPGRPPQEGQSSDEAPASGDAAGALDAAVDAAAGESVGSAPVSSESAEAPDSSRADSTDEDAADAGSPVSETFDDSEATDGAPGAVGPGLPPAWDRQDPGDSSQPVEPGGDAMPTAPTAEEHDGATEVADEEIAPPPTWEHEAPADDDVAPPELPRADHGATRPVPWQQDVPPSATEAREAPVPPPAPSVETDTTLIAAPTDPGVAEPQASSEPEPRLLPDPTRFVRPLPRVLAVANQKGGVGKTTTTVNLGASLAVLGYRVLVIDLDPQGNATTGLGINSRNLDTSIYDVILHDTPLEDCIEPTSLRNLYVAPATIDLAGAEIELVPAFSRELRLRRALEEVKEDYDFVLVDCPPSLGLLTVNALTAASEVLVPIQCEYYALEGLGQLLRNVNLVQSNLNPKLELNVIVLTMYDARTKLAEQVADEVREYFGDRVCRNVVPRTVRLSEAPSFGQPIIVFDPSSRGALAYRELAKEVSGGPPQRSG